MNDLEKVCLYLKNFVNHLMDKGELYDSHEVEIRMSNERRMKSNFNTIKFENNSEFIQKYSIWISFKVDKNSGHEHIHSDFYENLYKCLAEIEMKLKNSIDIYKKISKFEQQMAGDVAFDELSYLKKKLQDALQEQNYDEAAKLRDKIAPLESNPH